jgi:hypothetical protein
VKKPKSLSLAMAVALAPQFAQAFDVEDFVSNSFPLGSCNVNRVADSGKTAYARMGHLKPTTTSAFVLPPPRIRKMMQTIRQVLTSSASVRARVDSHRRQFLSQKLRSAREE